MTTTEQKQGNKLKNMTLRKVPQHRTKAAPIEHLYLVVCRKPCLFEKRPRCQRAEKTCKAVF